MKVLVLSLLHFYCIISATGSPGTIIGIDLGTTHSSVAAPILGGFQIIPNGHGSRVTPSYAAFTPEGERLIGQEAKNQASINPSNTLYNSKRLIGRTWDDPFVKKHIRDLPFDVIQEKGKPYFKVSFKGKQHKLAPEEVSAMVLRNLKETAETFLGHPVKNAIVTVPAYFNNEQRQATIDAGKIAGLTVVRTISEPTAAAIAFGINKQKEENILVFDFGGGTLDVSILKVNDDEFTVLAVKGNSTLGGEDFNERMVAHFLKLYKNKHGQDASKNSRARGKLRKEVEQAKISLSFRYQANIDIEAFYGGKDYSDKITRAEFEDINKDLFLSTLEPVRDALKDANLKKEDINEIVLVGGSTRIPKIQTLVQDFFNGKRLSRSINPDEAVAIGAAIFGRAISKQKASEDEEELLIYDVCPISLGTQIEGGVMSVLIPRNTRIPTVQTKIYTTTIDYQESIEIDVYQGERTLVKKNLFLGTFILDGIESALKRIPEIEVTFEINSDSILIVTAKNLNTKHQDTLTITNHTNRLSDEDIERMIQNAKLFEEEDKRTKEKLVARNSLYEYIDTQMNKIKESKAPKDIKSKHLQFLEESIKWLKRNPDISVDKLKAKRLKLEEYCNSMNLRRRDDL